MYFQILTICLQVALHFCSKSRSNDQSVHSLQLPCKNRENSFSMMATFGPVIDYTQEPIWSLLNVLPQWIQEWLVSVFLKDLVVMF